MAVNSDEDEAVLSLVKAGVSKGIFIHHADVPRTVREEIERIAARPALAGEFHVILATQTLAYGVNLAVNDVVLLGYKFYESNRMTSAAERKPLDLCSFHNMVGRAGRLGVFPNKVESQAFIIVPNDENAFAEIVRRYYSQNRPDARSQSV